ncbi:MAG: ABC transporter ATP-binding protein [Bacteroidetes bacterium]|nr:ABC transporter ATP-binding protein [Bacteroidota bacterium]MBK8144587.1 ABC transporter ATP-binding protein [Bacteroidota bacterium]MBP6314147.1 ABC transporter ATP-binding protein [Chitinophagaceae bacterium]
MLSTNNLSKSYGDLNILKGVSIEVQRGEIVSIVGASGAGKSTLLHIIGTLDRPDSGKVLIDDVDVFSLSATKIAQFRNQKIGFVFQFHHLLPEFSALENVMMPALINNVSVSTAQKKASSLLDRMQLNDRLHHKPSELSGGEQQRVAIARSLINDPAIILADEPTGNLDSSNSLIIFDMILQLRAELQQTFILVTHNDELAKQSDRTLRMADGKTI